MVFFGVVGYILRKIKYHPAPFILAMILGPMMETSLRQSLAISQWDLAIFIQRPFSAVLLTLVLLVMILLIFLQTAKKRRFVDEE